MASIWRFLSNRDLWLVCAGAVAVIVGISVQELGHHIVVRALFGEWGEYRWTRVDTHNIVPDGWPFAVMAVVGAVAELLWVGFLTGLVVGSRGRSPVWQAAAIGEIGLLTFATVRSWLDTRSTQPTFANWTVDFSKAALPTASPVTALDWLHATFVSVLGVCLVMIAYYAFWKRQRWPRRGSVVIAALGIGSGLVGFLFLTVLAAGSRAVGWP